MSTKVERSYRLSSDSLAVQDTLKMKLPLSGSLSYFQQHVRQLERNTETLRALFPHIAREPMRLLLEELDNNVEMATKILNIGANNSKSKPPSPLRVEESP